MRVAVIGLGNAGFTLHLPALAGIPGVEVVGALDTDTGRRDRAAARFSVRAFDDFDRLMREARPDVVLVGTPPDSHLDYCLRSLAGGAHVLCEKPFVSSLAEADTVIEAAAAARRGVALNHEFREMPIFRAVRDEAARLGNGSVVFAQVWQLIDMPPWAEPGWRGQLTQRSLFEAGVHQVDFLMALFGEKPVAVTAQTSTGGLRDGDADAVALVTLEFSRRRLATIVQNRLCKGQTQYFEVRAETPSASLRASFGGRARVTAGLFRSSRPHARIEFGASGLAWSEAGASRRILGRNPRNPNMVATRLVIERSLAAFRDGTEPPTSARAARDVLEVVAAGYHSAQIGRTLRLDEPAAQALRSMRMGAPPDR